MLSENTIQVEVNVFNRFHTRWKISADKVLWIWAAAMAIGLLAFYIIIRGFPVGDTTLVFEQWWEDELDRSVLEKIVEDFETENPGIKVRLEKNSMAGIRRALEADADITTKRKKRQADADIYSLEGAWIDGVEGALVPMEKYGSRSLSVITFINPLFYNIALLEASGFDRPPKSQAEFLAYAQAITKPEQFGAVFALDAENPHGVSRYLLSWIWSAGLPQSGPDSISRALEKFNFNSKEVTETLSFLSRLKPYLHPRPFETGEEEKLALFTEGKAGMMIGSVSDVKKIREKMQDGFGITTIPGPASYVGKPVFALSGWYVGVGAGSKNQKEAEIFIAFLLERASDLALASFAVPGSGSRNSELMKTDPHYAKAFEMYDAGEIVREVYGSGRTVKLNAVIYEETRRMLDGARSPEDTAAAIQSRWENGG